MSGYSTRRRYDSCANRQYTRQSTDPMNFNMEISKYVNCENFCRPSGFNSSDTSGYAPVDIESSLRGIDRTASDCSINKYPFKGPKGAIVPNDSGIMPHITPYACERGRIDENKKAVIKTNMGPYKDSGLNKQNPTKCFEQGNGYYAGKNREQKL